MPRIRFTPTCVGKTRCAARADSSCTVHPHVRGEDLPYARRVALATGSPPRAWGRLKSPLRSRRPCRFTPTCVGKTRKESKLPRPLPVHPHVRGEDGRLGGRETRRDGSPPRAWGRLEIVHFRDAAPRFTPTCVGKTPLGVPCIMIDPVHPHVRGEDRRIAQRARPGNGSPPRAWGRPSAPPARQALIRFTPTCVGKTASMRLPRPPEPVHPHVRGEDRSKWRRGRGRSGSPPRAWGRQPRRLEASRLLRFTPTCVGKTKT